MKKLGDSSKNNQGEKADAGWWSQQYQGQETALRRRLSSGSRPSSAWAGSGLQVPNGGSRASPQSIAVPQFCQSGCLGLESGGNMLKIRKDAPMRARAVELLKLNGKAKLARRLARAKTARTVVKILSEA